MKATLLKTWTDRKGEKRLYRCEPPMVAEEGPAEFVVVSAIGFAFDTGRPETYIFAADSEGDVTNFTDLPGSFQGDFDHHEALRRAGYEAANAAAEVAENIRERLEAAG